MNNSSNFTKIIVGVASLVFSTGVFASTEYLVSDAHSNDVKIMDGISHGVHVSSSGDMMINSKEYKGDKITNLSTNKSGIITGIKHQGSMDVMGSNGKTVRYQYVTFKVKHL